MDIPLNIQLGISGELTNVGSIFLNPETIGNSSSWAGSYHILSMGRHYRDYISYAFPEMQTNYFPPIENYFQLTTKNAAQQVIGNFGECVAAIFARRFLNARIGNINLLKTKKKIQMPDYLMDLENDQIRNFFDEILPSGFLLQSQSSQKWWPVESKATTSFSDNDPRKKAINQLLSFWLNEKSNLPDSIGYGMIVSYAYDEPREVLISLIIPENPEKLKNLLGNKPTKVRDKVKMKKKMSVFYRKSLEFLYDCKT
jgi:hypothetical protein